MLVMKSSKFFNLILMACLAIFSPLRSEAKTDDARVEIVGQDITIRTEIVIYGPAATAALARRIEGDILELWARAPGGSAWTHFDPFSKSTYRVHFDVEVTLYGGKERQTPSFIPGTLNPFNRKNYIKCVSEELRSNVIDGDEGTWVNLDLIPQSSIWQQPRLYAHEFGHLVGLDDRYEKVITGNNKSSPITRYVPSPGWENNIMDDSSTGVVEQRNIDAIARRILARRRSQYSNNAGLDVLGSPRVYRNEINISYPRD